MNLAGYDFAEVLQLPVDPGLLGEILEDADALVLDPPRSGVDAKSLRVIAESDVERIVMVSCNPATFARDLKGLFDGGYRLQELRAFDLFEMTEHVEVVGLLTR